MPKVLIVEDDEALRTVFCMIVERAGYNVQLAKDGSEGLKQLSSFSPDIVLLDMLMPVKSGLELLQEAQVTKNYPETTVIVLSNLSDSKTIDKALELGAVKHLIKSNIAPQDLINTVKEYTG